MIVSSKTLRRSAAIVARGMVMAVVLFTAACSADTTFWSPAASPKVNKVTLTHLTHDVMFAANTVDIDSNALAGLQAFLDRQQVGYGDRVYVVAASANPDPVATRRAEGVSGLLARQGLSATVLANAEWAGVPASGNGVRVLVHRFVVVAPRCPDWRKPAKADYGNTQASNFGCADAVNLGMMVADPRDLVEGRSMGGASGDAAAAAVKRYRDGKVMPLDASGTGTK